MKGKNNILIILLVLTTAFTLKAQQSFYGLQYAGNTEFGGIFKTDAAGGNVESVHGFTGISGAYPQYGSLCRASNGKLYGLSSQGGLYGKGVLYAYNPDSETYTKLHDFDGTGGGSNPSGGLLLVSDSLLYGMSTQGGTQQEGVLFVYNITNGTYTKLHDFAGNSSGKFPYGSLEQGGDGKLYGLCYQGGTANEGVLFAFDPADNSVRIKVHFTGSNGRNPFGSLLHTGNGLLYGLCYQGGSNNAGVLFRYNVSDSSFTLLQHFDGSSKGSNPYGSLCKYNDSLLYGLTFLGGSNNTGAMFSYSVADDTLLKLHDFGIGNDGRNPYGNLIKASNGHLYGLCYSGGNSNSGTLFTYRPQNTTYSILRHFAGGSDGRNPYGTLCETEDSILCGTTYRGGISNTGTIFELNLKTSAYKRAVEFGDAPGGKNALGSLIKASNGLLYGLTQYGGRYNRGVIFSFNPLSDTFQKLFDFDGINSGAYPAGSLTLAANGILYGMCKQGGAYGNGVLFEFDPFNDTYDKLLDFDGNNGSTPTGDLYWDNTGILYGMTSYGGRDDYGVLFAFNPSASTYNKLIDFNDSNGSSPFGSLCGTGSGKLYGLTYQGGSAGAGVLFCWQPDSSLFAIKHAFGTGAGGAYPQGSLSRGTDQKLYGMSSSGGSANAGCIFVFDTQADTLSTLFSFNDSNGKSPTGNLTSTYRGTFLGMSPGGGANSAGVLFEFNPAGKRYSKKYDFDLPGGSSPFGSLCGVCMPVYSKVNISSCDSFTAFSGKQIWKQSGEYTDTLSTYTGCDSIIRITLSILQKSYARLDTALCARYTGPDNNTYDSSGVYTFVLQNAAGCDSILSVHLKMLNTTAGILVNSCGTYTAPDGKRYDSSGIYTAIIPNSAGCDSSILIALNILNSASAIDTSVCFRYRAPDGKTYDSSGWYTAVIPNHAGCDSTIAIRLNIRRVNTAVQQNGHVLNAETENAAYRWLDCLNNFEPVSGAVSRWFTAARNGAYAAEISENGCTDTSECLTVNTLSLPAGFENSGFTLYPNPNRGSFTLSLGAVYARIRVELTDQSGRMVFASVVEHTDSIVLETGLSSGIYLFRAIAEQDSGSVQILRTSVGISQ